MPTAIRIYPHTTRLSRSGEAPGVHSVFLREERFDSNFREGLYIEDSLEFVYMPGLGIYYGYSREQMDLLKKNGFCSSPASTQIARRVFYMCGCDVNWVHLECDDKDSCSKLVS